MDQLSTGDYFVGDLVADFLVTCGISTAFGIISVHNIPILNRFSKHNEFHFVTARGEMGAGHMADAYARVTNGLSLLITSTGPGAANAVSALAEAKLASSPVLHLTGQIPTRFAGRGMGVVHDMAGQFSMLQSVSKATYQIRSANDALGILAKAVAEALAPPRGPVSVEIPIDIQRTSVSRAVNLADLVPQPAARQLPSASALDSLAEAVLAARRPMVWLGSGARTAGTPTKQLLDLGFRAVTSWAGRGVVPEDDPRTLGALNGLGLQRVQDFYQTVDLMLVVGSRIRGHETLDFSVRLPPNIAQIDIDPMANGRTFPASVFVQGDASATLESLVERLHGRMQIDPSFAGEFDRMRDAAREDLVASLGPYSTFPEQLRAALPKGTLWVRDITIANTAWGNRLMPLHDASENVYSIGAGIGMGLSHGIGAAVAASGRHKTVVLSGDLGFAMNMSELWTAIQERLDITVIVMNDGGYGVIRQIQDAVYGGERCYDHLAGPNLSSLAQTAGIPFWKVSQADGIGSAVSAALKTFGPSLIEVDVPAIGQIPPYFPYNVHKKV